MGTSYRVVVERLRGTEVEDSYKVSKPTLGAVVAAGFKAATCFLKDDIDVVRMSVYMATGKGEERVMCECLTPHEDVRVIAR